jgi:hypothetical protein
LRRPSTHRNSGWLTSLFRCASVGRIVLAGIASCGICSDRSGASSAVNNLPANAEDFVRDVLHHEISAQERDHALWTYREEKRKDGKSKFYLVYQTEYGELARWTGEGGQSLTREQAREEDQRITKLISDPAAIHQKQRKERVDAAQARDLLRMFPDAFQFEYNGTQGALVRLVFTPNPKFRPPNHTGLVFHHMTGSLVLDPAQKRLASIHGTLTSAVKFFGGLFGHLDKGGTFDVEQQEVRPGYWEVTAMHVHMSGKALFFKTIAVQEDETYSDFALVSGNPTLSEAAQSLRQESESMPQAISVGDCRRQ